MVRLGIEVLLAEPARADAMRLAGVRVGLLCNQASTDSRLRHSRDLLRQILPGQLTCLFTPQHGFFADRQDNMVESPHAVDPATGLPVFSLYADSRRPTKEMFDLIDVLLVDLQDVGTRVYTFIWTLAYCLEAAAQWGKRVIVLDRPNPVGGEIIEGGLVRPEWTSFVGLYPLPMRHGLTIGELARLLNDHFAIGAELDVVSMQGWRRWMLFRHTGLPWVFPSPNMPTPETALVYPGQVIWEGTNVSEGRGTCLPFELCGAPYWRPEEIRARLPAEALAGCVLRPVAFEPVSNKWRGDLCFGFQIHVADPSLFRPLRLSLALLAAVMDLPAFGYKEPPYEYEYERLPLDLILGDDGVRCRLEAGEPVAAIEADWRPELAKFDQLRQAFFLY